MLHDQKYVRVTVRISYTYCDTHNLSSPTAISARPASLWTIPAHSVQLIDVIFQIKEALFEANRTHKETLTRMEHKFFEEKVSMNILKRARVEIETTCYVCLVRCDCNRKPTRRSVSWPIVHTTKQSRECHVITSQSPYTTI